MQNVTQTIYYGVRKFSWEDQWSPFSVSFRPEDTESNMYLVLGSKEFHFEIPGDDILVTKEIELLENAIEEERAHTRQRTQVMRERIDSLLAITHQTEDTA